MKFVNRQCVLTNGDDISNIFQHIKQNPDCIIMTITKIKALELNLRIAQSLYQGCESLANVQMDCDCEPINIYKGMKIVVTMNRDKENKIVNGQFATIEHVRNDTIFIKLMDGSTQPLYKVTDSQKRTVYPFMLRYAVTVAKIQGQTLKQALVYFDVDKLDLSTTYVALSRVRTMSDLKLVHPLHKDLFKFHLQFIYARYCN